MQGGRPHGGGYLRERKCLVCGAHVISLEVLMTRAVIEKVSGVKMKESKAVAEHRKAAWYGRDWRRMPDDNPDGKDV